MRAGTFPATVLKTTFTTSQKKKTPGFLVDVTVHDDEEGDFDHFGYIWISKETEKSLRMARKSMKAIGWDIDNDDLKALADLPLALKGKKCEVVIVEEVYNDQATLKIAFFNEPSKPGDPSLLDDLTKALRSVKSKKADHDEPEPGPKDDEIPF